MRNYTIIPNQVFELDISPTEFKVLVFLLKRRFQKSCSCSIAEVAIGCKISANTAKTGLDRLSASGIIRVIPVSGQKSQIEVAPEICGDMSESEVSKPAKPERSQPTRRYEGKPRTVAELLAESVSRNVGVEISHEDALAAYQSRKKKLEAEMSANLRKR